MGLCYKPFRHDFVVPPFLPETGTLLSASQTIFAPRTGTPSSLRDTPSNRGNYPNRGITFQGRQEIYPPAFYYRQLVAPLGEMSKFLENFDRGVNSQLQMAGFLFPLPPCEFASQ